MTRQARLLVEVACGLSLLGVSCCIVARCASEAPSLAGFATGIASALLYAVGAGELACGVALAVSKSAKWAYAGTTLWGLMLATCLVAIGLEVAHERRVPIDHLGVLTLPIVLVVLLWRTIALRRALQSSPVK